MGNSSKKTPVWLWLTLAILSWSTVASACKWTLAFVHPFWMLLIATFTASFVLWLLLSFHPSCSVHQKIQWKWVFIGLINPFLYYSLLFEAYRLSPAQEALVLNYTWAVALAILSAIVFKKALELKVLVGMLVSFSGVWLIISQGSLLVPTLRLGNFLALISALIWAVYWILNMTHEEAPLAALFIQFVSAIPAILMSAIIFAGIPPSLTIQAILGSAYLGVFEMSLPFFWWLLVLRSSNQTTKAIHWIYLSPVLSMIWIALFLGEGIKPYAWYGLLLVIGGLLLGKITNQSKRNLKTFAK